MKRLEGHVCLVTGSTGLAAAAARRLAAEGAALFITSKTEANCHELAAEIAAAGGRAVSRRAELTDEAEVEAAVSSCVEAFGRIDGCYSAAGGSGRRFGDGPIHEVTGDAWDRTIALNLRSQALVAGAVVRTMLESSPNAVGSRGSIVLLSSVLAFSPVPELFATHAYAAAKGGIVSLGLAMAAAYAGSRIRVNVVAPSLTDTPMAARASADPGIVAFAGRKQPLVGGFLDADDVAGAVAYFLSDESRAVTGQVLAIDGGWSVTSASMGEPT